MKLPRELIDRIQYDYAAYMYKSGAPVFNSINTDTITIVIDSLVKWAKEKNYSENNKIDFSVFTLDS